MEHLLGLKRQLENFYGKYDIYINVLIRFIISFFVLYAVNGTIGFFAMANNIFIIIALAMVSAFVGTNFSVFVASGLVFLHVSKLSVEIAILFAMLLLVLYLVYFRYEKKDWYILLIVPLSFVVGIPYVMPLIYGLKRKLTCAVPLTGGVMFYYMIRFIGNNSVAMGKALSEGSVSKMEYVISQLINNREMLLAAITFVLTLAVVCATAKLFIARSREIGLIAGILLNIAMFITGDFVFNVKISIIGLLIGSAVSLIIAIALNFFMHTADYSKIERVQFEDDDYYYYVKAVPKMYIAKPDRVIKRFSADNSAMEEITEEDLAQVKNMDEDDSNIDFEGK